MSEFDREIELKKLDIVKEAFQGNHALANSILSTAMIALLVLVVTLGISHPQYSLGALFGILIIVVIFSVGFYSVHTRNMKALGHYDIWISDIQNSKSLPTIVQMGKEIEKKIK